jgi:hypothetical protein
MEIIVRESSSWETVLSQWSVPRSLVDFWDRNRQVILEYCNARYPKFASSEVLNNLVRAELRPFLIETFPKPVKAQSQPQVNVSTITAEQIRQRAVQREQDRYDEEQKLRNTALVNHARSQAEAEEIAFAEAKRKSDHEYRMERLRQVMH